jgi:hypothetical protein
MENKENADVLTEKGGKPRNKGGIRPKTKDRKNRKKEKNYKVKIKENT